MALSGDDREALDRLSEASGLYNRYLEIAQVGRLPLPGEELAYEDPPPVDLPLTLRVHLS